MPTWVKVVLAIVIVGFVLLVAGIIVAARWVKSQAPALDVAMKEAEAFGKGKDGEACIAETLNRLRASDGIVAETKTKLFLQHCLASATVAPETCQGVPGLTEFMKLGQWSVDECKRRGWANDQRCIRVIGAVPAHCGTMNRQRG